MTDLEPAVIGDQLIRERLEAGGYGEAFTHWLGGSQLDTLAGTAVPGDVHLAVRKEIWTRHELPIMDLSWSPPDVDAILTEMLTAHGLLPDPEPLRIQPSGRVVVDPDWAAQFKVAMDADAHARDQAELDLTQPDWPTQELKAITKEDE